MSYPITKGTLERLRKWKKGEKAGPTNVELFLTDRCNLNCKFCEVSYRDECSIDVQDEMNWQTINRIIDESSDLGVESFFITGGEPAVRTDILIKTMKRIKSLDMYGHLVTNGTMLSEGQIEEIVKSGFDNIMISLDSPNPDVFNYLRGGKVFSEVKKNIELFTKYKGKYDTNKPTITITSVLTEVNYETIPEFISFAGDFDIDTIRFQPLITYFDLLKKFKIKDENLDKLRRIIADTEKLMEESDINTNMGEFMDERLVQKSTNINEILEEDTTNNISCYQPWYGIKINAEGKIGPCEGDFTWKSPVNVKNHKLEDIWHGEYFNSIRHRIKNDKLPEECSNCCIGKVFEQRQIEEKI